MLLFSKCFFVSSLFLTAVSAPAYADVIAMARGEIDLKFIGIEVVEGVGPAEFSSSIDARDISPLEVALGDGSGAASFNVEDRSIFLPGENYSAFGETMASAFGSAEVEYDLFFDPLLVLENLSSTNTIKFDFELLYDFSIFVDQTINTTDFVNATAFFGLFVGSGQLQPGLDNSNIVTLNASEAIPGTLFEESAVETLSFSAQLGPAEASEIVLFTGMSSVTFGNTTDIAPIPEPASVTLLLFGFAGLLSARRFAREMAV